MVLQSERYQRILETMKSSIWDSWCWVNCLWLLLLSNIYSTCSEVKEFTDVGNISTSVQFSRSVVSDSLWPRGLQHARLPCLSSTPRACSNSCASRWWCHPTISSSVIPFSSSRQSCPASGSFPVNQFFASGGQTIGVSASISVLPVNTQDWSSLGWIGCISLQSKGLSRVFSNTTVQKHQLFGAQPSSQSNSHIHTWPQEKP